MHTTNGIVKAAIVALAMTMFSGVALAEKQPAMEAAIKNLQEARDNLNQATHDKGGHRVKAVKLINKAIAEVRAGIEFDNKH